MKSHLLASILTSGICLIGNANAAILIPTDAAAWDKGSGGANGTGNGGLYQTTTLEVGLDKDDPNDPSTWHSSENDWPSDFQGQNVQDLITAGSNPWIVYDLGSVRSDLVTMFITTATEAGRGFKDVEIFYSSDLSTNQVTTWAGDGNLTDGAANVATYDFTAGSAWTKLGTTHTIATGDTGFGTQEFYPGLELDLSAISTQYIGFRALNTHQGGANGFGDRAGLNQIAFTTAIPEPSSFALIGIAGLTLLVRRRR